MIPLPDVPCHNCAKTECFVNTRVQDETKVFKDSNEKRLAVDYRKCKECGHVQFFDKDGNPTE